ncbi:hypothetical protein [Ruminococcus sp. Marseille-P6503]|uniref:hypothetical protein n=1 Tax=Ruminococcus sp. Marseille-P6503 TaxID=2364796 RepID=UPI000F5273E4|nr:hypothetical protein [Ruminococcus sp. Marseille-P6503]
MKKLISIITTLIIICTGVFSSLIARAEKGESYTSGNFTFYKLSSEDGNAYLGDFVDYLKGQIPSCFLLNYFISYSVYTFGSQDIYTYRYYAFDEPVTSIDLSYNLEKKLDKVIAYGSSQLYVTDNIVTGFYSNSYNTYGIDNPGKYIDSAKIVLYKDGFADNGQSLILNSQGLKIIADDVDITPVDPSAPPTPFTVSYTPNLSVNMKRSGILMAPGSPNDGIEITTEEIKVTICLNPDYVEYVARRSWEYNHARELGASDENSIQDLLSAYDGTESGTETSLEGLNKKLMFFITGANPSTASPRAVVENSVYTYLSKQKYSIVDIDNGEINGSTSTATYANGLYPWFDFCDMSKYFEDIKNITGSEYKNFIEDLPSKTITINLENVYFTDDYPTYYPVLITDSTAPVSFSAFDLTSDTSPNGAIIFNKENADGTKHDDTVYDNGTFVDYWENKPIQYVYLGNEFSFDDYPEYTPFKYNGDEYTTKGNPFSYTGDTAYKPDSYQSVNSDGTLSDERTAEEQKKYDDEIRWQNNFSTDFGVGSITDLLNGTSTFYEFLTACIAILPSWFLTILASFFVVLLALVVIKFVI